MSKESLRGRGVSGVLMAVAFLAIEPRAVRDGLAAETRTGFAGARLTRVEERFALAHAIDGAARRLAHAECQGLLDEFADPSGTPLRVVLEAQAIDAVGYVYRLFFYDAPVSACEHLNLAMTTRGSRVVFVCGPRFAREVKQSSSHAEAVIIHEMLHSLGLGENPPSSEAITSRVMARCRQDGPIKTGATLPSPFAPLGEGRVFGNRP